jgi:hypothetical protein
MTRAGVRNRDVSPFATFGEQTLSGTLSVAADGDIYRIFQAIRESYKVIEFGTSAGTVVGGTTIDINLRKNGVSMLTAPVSYVTNQGVILMGVLTSLEPTVGQGDILDLRFSKVGGGTFGQIAWWLKYRPLLGTEANR